ncbi:alkaline phosphatase family protein [Plantactinospora siamensis]|uniref:Alkaline phosphatase family protein n=1 Tax=Plantactinospora siamensis TaxID=555372 RepID=A0ABV6NVW7_9ACTN
MSPRRGRTALLAALLTATAATATTTAPAGAATAVPAFDHIVLVMFENHSYGQINGSSSAPYLNSLAGQGAKFTASYAVTHPSQPNYIALFSGSTQGVTSDSCPKTFSGTNLGSQLIGAGRTFTGYSEGMPSDGYTGCSSGNYQRKHNAWVDFTNVPASSNRTYAAFPADYTTLPAVAFITPDMCHDMHDCSVSTGDTWARANLDAYAQWAKTHNSLLIVTFDEDNSLSGNHIFTAFVGAHVRTGSYGERITHYTVLRTIEAAYGLPGINNAASLSPILDVWQ